MSVVDPKKFRDTLIRSEEPNNLYFLVGDEPFLIEEALDTLKKKIISESIADFNFDIFYGQNADIAQVCDTIETLPMMSGRRLVVIKEFQDFSEKEMQHLMRFVQAPVETTTLVLVATKFDQRRKFFKQFSENGTIVKFQKPYENQVPYWVQYIAHRNDLKIQPGAVTLLCQIVGSNLMEIDNEVKKLGQYIAPRHEISPDDVLDVVSRSRLMSVFDFTNAIACRDRVKAILCLVNLLDAGQNEIGILALVARHFRILVDLREARKEGLQGKELSSRVGVPNFFLRQYLDQTENWSVARLEKAFNVLLDTDRALKSSPASSHIWMENFILKACSL